jgi:hypothetical protein
MTGAGGLGIFFAAKSRDSFEPFHGCALRCTDKARTRKVSDPCNRYAVWSAVGV